MKFNNFKSHLIRWLFSIIGISRGQKQLLKEFRFTIGEQYENYEFDLKDKGSKIFKGITYEMYLYDKDDFETLFNIPISRGVLLLFNADILEAIYYRFEGNHFEYLLNEINNYLPKNQKLTIDPFVKFRATAKLSENEILEILVKDDSNTGLALKSANYRQSLLHL